MDHNIGKKLAGRYEICELIGIGGMADVYKAIDIMEEKLVAVKILKNEFAGNEEFLRRFRNESKAIAVLSHPNIVKIYDVDFTEKAPYIVMEYIDGITLKEFMEQQGALKWKDAVHFSVQILRALQHAHDRGIVHRDIKPQNIMLFSDGTIKVMDFGIARFAREDGKTLSDKTIGSVHYISPEQARGEITDEKSDIYSVGAMLYEMITGTKPFDADTPVAVALMHMQEVARMPRDIIETIPEGLEEITLHAMQKDARRRYQSASEMIKDMDLFKINPSIVFGYSNATKIKEDTAGQTIYFKPIAKPSAEKIYNEPDYEEDGEEDDDEPSRSSMLIHALTAVTAGVVIIAAVLIAVILYDKLKTDSKETFVPNLVGMPYVDAVTLFDDFVIVESAQEYSPEYAEGIITWQDKSEGRQIKVGDAIKVKVSKGNKMVEIPNVINYTYDSAKSTLELNDLIVERREQFDDNITKNYVIKTEPFEYTKVAAGSTVIVYVSKGPVNNEVPVPDVTGKSYEEALSIINGLKLTPIYVPVNQIEDPDTVISQLPEVGTIVARGDTVQLFVSTGTLGTDEYELSLAIPQPSYGSYKVLCYNSNSNLISTAVINDASVVQFFPIVIPGSNTQDIRIEIQSLQTFKYQYYATYRIDFTTQSNTRLDFDLQAFQKANAGAQINTTPTPTTTTEEPTHPLENTED